MAMRGNKATASQSGLGADLVAVLAAVTDGEPRVMAVRDGSALPSGPFRLAEHSLQSGLRAWVERQTGQPLGYIEQLYTFADAQRAKGRRLISISYLGLTRESHVSAALDADWHNWYKYFPWEDLRAGTPRVLREEIIPQLKGWVSRTRDAAIRRMRNERLAISYGLGSLPWNEELILQRYELAYEAGLVAEAAGARCAAVPGRSMLGDHRRILATGIARLRAKIKYRPVVFELLPPTFTLLQLQTTVEALAGRLVHKPNFRRLIAQQELVEPTGATAADTRGRPAKLYRFRRALLAERAAAGTKLPLTRT